ncbi:MAG: hypothetical protein AB6733_06015 [Clostridiaceae bacterium]
MSEFTQVTWTNGNYVGGLDVDGGVSMDAATVVPDEVVQTTALPNTSNTNIGNFNIIWPTINDYQPISIQLGANSGQFFLIDLCKADSVSLGVNDVDLAIDSSGALSKFHEAINTVSYHRGRFRDADIAKEMR